MNYFKSYSPRNHPAPSKSSECSKGERNPGSKIHSNSLLIVSFRVLAMITDSELSSYELSQSCTPRRQTPRPLDGFSSETLLDGQPIHVGGFLCRNIPPTVGRSPKIARNHWKSDGSNTISRQENLHHCKHLMARDGCHMDQTYWRTQVKATILIFFGCLRLSSRSRW
jgi:hypothetical protein